MGRLLDELEANEASEREAAASYELQLAAVEAARAARLLVAVPAAPQASVLSILRKIAQMPTEQRLLAANALSLPGGTLIGGEPQHVVVMKLFAEAVRRGLVAGFKSVYQLWTVFAMMVLRDEDVGELIRTKHPERVALRSPRLTEGEVRKLDADLARKERKRVQQEQEAFGYSVTSNYRTR